MIPADPNGETTCPDSPFPILGDDCGEGISLNGASFAVLYGNVIQANRGGILMSNELGVTHDNVILRNRVLNNVSDCGITMASHPSGFDESGAPLLGNGVYNKHISYNVWGCDSGPGSAGCAGVVGDVNYTPWMP